MSRPKSALELALERLADDDREAGIQSTPLSDEQKAAIAEVRKRCEASLAECQILHRDALGRSHDPAERERLEEEFLIDRRRLEADRDREIEKIRRGG